MEQKKGHNQVQEKTKKIKARVLSEDGDLEFSLIDVPVSDKRPEFNPKTDTLHSKTDVAKGNPLGQ